MRMTVLIWGFSMAFALVVVHQSPIRAAVIASGSLQQCFNNGTDALDCSKKLVVTLTVENNKLYDTDSLQFNVACINSPTGTCPCPCSFQTDPSCQCRDFKSIISVSVTKTPVYAVYPLSQPATFNGRPYEGYITTGPGGTVGGTCSDSPYDANPTCGWATTLNANGTKESIPNSQGFCCECPTFGGYPIYRGYRQCSFSSSWQSWNLPGSAHCLRYDDYWWYRGYVIGQYQLDFDIQITINTTNIISSSNNNTSNSSSPNPAPDGNHSSTTATPGSTQAGQEVLTLNPSQTFLVNQNHTVSAQLLGDLESYLQIQNLQDYWVMIPLQPGLAPNEVFTSNLDMWVIFPPELVSVTGECNKIGVGYAAFRSQPDACNQPLGSCLDNQIYDYGLADTSRIAGGLEPLFNITRYGGGWQNERQVAAAQDGVGLVLRLPIIGIRTSLVTLEVRADDLQLVTNRAPGKIISSKVCTFDGQICGGFQAIAGAGYLKVLVQNTGAVAAEYRAGVLGCSTGILPVVEQYATIAPNQTYEFSMKLQTETDQAGNMTCTVVVTDSAGDIADSTLVNFYTNSTSYTPPPNQSDTGNKITQPGNPPTFSDRCRTLCPNVFNLKCLIFKGCWKRLATGVISILLICAGITILWLAIKNGWLVSALKVVCTCIFKPEKKNPPPPPSFRFADAAVTAYAAEHWKNYPPNFPPPQVPVIQHCGSSPTIPSSPLMNGVPPIAMINSSTGHQEAGVLRTMSLPTALPSSSAADHSNVNAAVKRWHTLAAPLTTMQRNAWSNQYASPLASPSSSPDIRYYVNPLHNFDGQQQSNVNISAAYAQQGGQQQEDQAKQQDNGL